MMCVTPEEYNNSPIRKLPLYNHTATAENRRCVNESSVLLDNITSFSNKSLWMGFSFLGNLEQFW